MKIGVLGDHFAQLDAHAGHWVKMWADQEDHTVEFLGLTGSNMVEICEHARSLNFEEYDLLIVYVTDLQRFNTRTPGKIELLETQDAEFLRETMKNEAEWLNVTPGNGFGDSVRQAAHVINDHTDPSDPVYQIYTHLSGSWLAAANHAAIEGLEARLGREDINVVWVIPTMGDTVYPWCELKNVWNTNIDFDRTYRPTAEINQENASSINSFGITWHRAALKTWLKLIKKKKIQIE